MRPISDKFWGNPQTNPNAIVFDQVWIPGQSSPSKNAFIVEQVGTRRYMVEDENGNRGVVRLDSHIQSEGQAIINFVVPMDPSQVTNQQMQTTIGPAPTNVRRPKFVITDPVRNLAFLAHHGGDGGAVGGISAYDIIDPENPVLLSTRITGWSVNMITRRGNFLFIDNNNLAQRIQCIDVTDPSNMTIVSTSPQNSGQLFGHTADDEGNIVYAASASGQGLKVYDFTDKENPIEYVNSINFNAGGTAYHDGHVFITNYSTRKILKYNVSDPANPVFVAESQVLGTFLVGIVCQGGILFAADYNGVNTYIVDPSTMALLSTVQTPSHVPQIAGGAHYDARRNRLIVQHGMNNNPGLSIFDVTNLTAPVLITQKPLPGLNSVERGDIVRDHIFLGKRFPAPEGFYVGKIPTLQTLRVSKLQGGVVKTTDGQIFGWDMDGHQIIDTTRISN